MELTREVLEDMAGCRERYCPDCRGVCKVNNVNSGIETLAKALLAEMDKPKVWDGAPDYAGRATVTFEKGGSDNTTIWSKVYTRELPKSRERQIAELFFEDEAYILACEAAILKDREEREANR